MTATNSEPQDEGKRDNNKQYVREIKDRFSDKGSVVFRDFEGNDHRSRPFRVEV